MGHRLYDFFHRFAEEVDKQQVQHDHRRDHSAEQHEVVLAMKTADEVAMITLEYERLDEATVLAVAHGRRDQPVLTVVAIDLCRLRRLYCWPNGVPRCEQIIGVGGRCGNQSRESW